MPNDTGLNFKRVMTTFLDMNTLVGRNASCAEIEFQSVDQLFQKHGINWDNVTGVGVDNTNSNIGNFQCCD